MPVLALLASSVATATASAAPSGIGTISTVAGNGALAPGGDGVLATDAGLWLPRSVAAVAGGGFVVADSGFERVRLVDAGGLVRTVAGNTHCVPGFLDDDTSETIGPDPASALAPICTPTAVAVDSSGRVVFAQTGQVEQSWRYACFVDSVVCIQNMDTERVRVLDAAGTMTTIAGGLDAGAGSLNHVAISLSDWPEPVVEERVPARLAHLFLPAGLAVLGGSVYISDSRHHRVRRVDQSGRISTVAGTGLPRAGVDGVPGEAFSLDTPRGLAIALDSDLIVADSGNHAVRRIDADTGTVTTIAGTGSAGYSGDAGPARHARMRNPSGVAVAPDGSIYVADTGNHVVRRIGPDGVIATVAGTGQFGFAGDGGPATSARLYQPMGVSVDALSMVLYVADTRNYRIRAVQLS